MMPPAAEVALLIADVRDEIDHDELVDQFARRLIDRATYRETRVLGIAGRVLCRHRGHLNPGLRGCSSCRTEIVDAWQAR